MADGEQGSRTLEDRERIRHQRAEADTRLRARVALALYLFGIAVVGGGVIIDRCGA
jgi:hypothetical protein